VGRLFLAVLAIGWAAVLIPAGLRRRPERGSAALLGLGGSVAGLFRRRGSRSSGGSGRGAAVLWPVAGGRPYPGGPVAPIVTSWAASAARSNQRSSSPRQASRNVRRQRQIVKALGALAVVTLFLSFVPGLRVLLGAHLVVDVVFAMYVVLLLRVKSGVPLGRPTGQRGEPGPAWTPDPIVYRRAVGE
jgi:hypothetical protein